VTAYETGRLPEKRSPSYWPPMTCSKWLVCRLCTIYCSIYFITLPMYGLHYVLLSYRIVCVPMYDGQHALCYNQSVNKLIYKFIRRRRIAVHNVIQCSLC